jgi:RND family efflux transporter MFP subunit
MRRLSALAIALTTTLSACSGANEGGAEKAAAGPAAVVVTRPARRDVAREVTLPVDFHPWEEIDVVTKVTGYVDDIRVDRGSVVARGDLLATIYAPEYDDERRKRAADVGMVEAAVASREADAGLQRVVAERARALVPGNAGTQQDADIATAREAVAVSAVAQMQAELVSARASLRVAETWVAYTTLRAPFAGVISRRLVHPGALVSASERTVLFHLVDASTIRADVDVPEAEAPLVVPGSTAALVSVAEAGLPRPAVVSRSETAVDRATRTMRVEIDIENRDGRLLPGMFGTARLTLELHPGALTVPSGAVSRAGEAPAVFVVADGRAKRCPVQVGLDNGRVAEIVSGLAEEASVIAQAAGIVDGAPVTVAEAGK